jgi:pimeloyl-ACP methyl ester carboxylesterase
VGSGETYIPLGAERTAMADELGGTRSEVVEGVHERVVAGAALDDDERATLDLCRDIAVRPETVTLPDGRKLGYADVGDPDGQPLVVHHGFPNSRVFGALFDAPASEHGVRVLAPERPGFGVSDPQAGRTLADWAEDLSAFAVELGLGSFPVLGVSAGGPYALASAAGLDRVERAGVAVGVGPTAAVPLRDRLPYLVARFLPPLVRRRLRTQGRRAREDPEAALEARADDAAPVDADHWRGAVGRALLLTHVEAARHHGVEHLAAELAIFGRSWDVDLEAIDVPVHMWYGEADRIVPVEMGRYLAERVPTAEASFHEGLGHVSAVLDNEDDIVATLLEG